MPNVASIVINGSTRQFDKEYSYIIPEKYMEKLKPGMRVIVPFGGGNRLLEGFILKLFDVQDVSKLKEIKHPIDNYPVITPELIELSKWMKQRYICTFADAIKCMIPTGISIKSIKIIKFIKNDDKVKGVKKEILQVLEEHNNAIDIEELKQIITSKTVLSNVKQLQKSGNIEIEEKYSLPLKEKVIKVAFITKNKEEILEDIESNNIKSIQQIKTLEILTQSEFIAVMDLIRFAGVSYAVLNTLEKKGYIGYKQIEVQRDPFKHSKIDKTYPLTPTKQQGVAIKSIGDKIEKKVFDEFLLHGATGSGKTEVYLQLIQKCMEQGRQAIVLVPEISLTPQMVKRFRGRFGDDVAIIHSRLSPGERLDQWNLIRAGKVKLVIGARSAVFAPFENLGIIIIDEEHENTYKSEVTPKYYAIDVARQRCRYNNAVLLCGSATPSQESYYKAKNKEINLVNMTERANSMAMPKVDIVDMKNELAEGNKSIFSKRLIEEIKINLEKGEQTILFLNKRGYASFVLCRNCGFCAKCPNCSISLTHHADSDRLICHYCGFTVKNFTSCPKCKTNYIKGFGTGTQRVEQEIKKTFIEASVIRMDLDTTTYKNSHEELLKKFLEENINIMIGTQMIAKGHDFPNVTLVGVLAADSLLNLPDFRSSEKTFQLITQVAGRAGRGEKKGRVIVQSYSDEHYSITCAKKHDYLSFYSEDIKIREELQYPPFSNVAVIVVSGVNDKQIFKIAKHLKLKLDTETDLTNHYDAMVLGPSRPPILKIKNSFRWRIIVKSKDINKLTNKLSELTDYFNKNKKRFPSAKLNIDINPFSML